MQSVRLPSLTDVAIVVPVEILASTALPYIQFSGVLAANQGAMTEGCPIAWNAGTGKYIKYAQGSGHTCVGFLRYRVEARTIDSAVEVIFAGAVKYSIVSAQGNWHANIITDLKARYAVVGDALMFF
jgi:hypothetical protein